MSKKQLLISYFVGLSILAIGIYVGTQIGSPSSKPEYTQPTSAKPVPSPEEIAVIRQIPKPKAPKSIIPDSPASPPARDALAPLDAPNTPPTRDILVLEHLFNEVHTVFHELPIGDNREITAFLRGQNPRDLTYIPADSPHLNDSGEIMDRWGTPYFFHALSRHHMEVRSAGPDRLHWSEDDIVSESVESQTI